MLNREPPAYEVGAVRKALEILCEFTSDEPTLSVSDLGRRLGMPKSTTHNLLRTLESLDFLKQDAVNRRYRLGPRVYELGLRFSGSTHLVSTALPYLRRLADETKETVKLALLSCDEVLIVSAIESPYQLHTRGDIGVRALLHCTGLGKAILAQLDSGEVRAIMARRGMKRFTPRTITTIEQLTSELARVRTAGYTIDWEEHEAGVVCAAAGVMSPPGPAASAMSVSGPSSRLDRERTLAYARLVLETSRSLERELAGIKEDGHR